MTNLSQARQLAALYALRDHLTGRATLPADSTARIRALLHPFVPLDGLLMPVLDLETAIRELEVQFPAVWLAMHLTKVEPAAVC